MHSDITPSDLIKARWKDLPMLRLKTDIAYRIIVNHALHLNRIA